MGTIVKFNLSGITEYYNNGKSTHSTNPPTIVTDTVDSIKASISEHLSAIPTEFDWEHIKKYSVDDQKLYWTTRLAVFSEVASYVFLQLQSNQPVRTSRSIPSGFSTDKYQFALFGSLNPTSDIDVSVEGPDASFLIANLEDAWLDLTGHSCRRWDVEFYGDFVMFLDENNNASFLNSREFNDSISQILPYIGISIMRNAENLEFNQLNEFIAAHPEIPELAKPEWKETAKAKMASIGNETYDQQRELYYSSLGKAEEIKKSHVKPNKQSNLSMFLLLCEANIYRSENYILPSTVIHVVRDIQAKAPQPSSPNDPKCGLYHVTLSTCALGKFTYLSSAMEQIGYMERFSYDPAKVKKYKDRFDKAMGEYSQKGGKRRARKTKRNRRAKRKSRRT